MKCPTLIVRAFTVYGNGGEFRVDSLTGRVLNLTPSEEPQAGYFSIVAFDVAEWKKCYPSEVLEGRSIDILDLGYWLEGGTYEEPAQDWRDDRRNTRAHSAADKFLAYPIPRHTTPEKRISRLSRGRYILIATAVCWLLIWIAYRTVVAVLNALQP